jgi:N-acetylglucosamine-6-sulfatase
MAGSRLRAVALLAALAAGACGGGDAPSGPSAPSGPPASRPNFVIVIADDMAYGLFGPERRFPFLRLPNLERLAARGTSFDHAYVTTSLCSPSRATLLSGLYAHTHGVFANEQIELSPALATYPKLLQAAGYDTAFVGKWHMNAQSDAPRPGFTYWLSFRGQGVYENPLVNENGRAVQRTGYLTDLLTDYAVDWLRRPRSAPFALVLSHKAPHNPAVPAPRHASLFPDAALPEPESFEDTFANKPSWQRRYAMCGGVAAAFANCPDPQPAVLAPTPWPAQDPGRLAYLRTLVALDESLGRVVAEVEAQGRAASTYVVFLSDNGLFLGEHRIGDKRLAYEESLHVPLVVAGPGVAAASVEPVVLNLDLAPTLLDLAGVPAPESMQGISFAPILRGGRNELRDAFLYEYANDAALPVIPPILALRTPNRKYVTYPQSPGEEELYDLVADPHELRNLARDPEWTGVRLQLERRLSRLVEETGATR